MAILKCKMCGGDLMLNENSSVAQCEYCGTKRFQETKRNFGIKVGLTLS